MDHVLHQLLRYDELTKQQFEEFVKRCRNNDKLRLLLRWGLFGLSLSCTLNQNKQSTNDNICIEKLLQIVFENKENPSSSDLSLSSDPPLLDPKLQSLHQDLQLYICEYLDSTSHRSFLLVNKETCSNVSSKGLMYLQGDWFYRFWTKQYTQAQQFDFDRTKTAKKMQLKRWSNVKCVELEESMLNFVTEDGAKTENFPFKKISTLHVADGNDCSLFIKRYRHYFEPLKKLTFLRLPKMQPIIVADMNMVLYMMSINNNVKNLTFNELDLSNVNEEVIDSADFKVLARLKNLNTFIVHGWGDGEK
eukprot:38378_1